MKKLLPLLFLVISLNNTAQTGTKNFIDQPYIEVTGKAEMEISPDLFRIRILIEEQDSKNKNSVAEQEDRMLKALIEAGVDTRKDLVVKDLSSNFKKYLLGGKDIILQKEYILTISDPKILVRTFSQLENAGISNVSIYEVENSRMEEYRKEVKIAAIKAAKDKASYLAGAIDQEIGKALYINESESYPVSLGYSNTLMYKTRAQNSNEQQVFEFENIKLEYSVSCRFELK